MHIAEGFLPVSHSVGWTIAAAPFVIYGGYAVVKQVKDDPDSKLLLAASGAFTFVLSAIKLPSVTGSSSHPTGTGMGAILFKPPVMSFLGCIVLLFQALLLAHGGITTLGANTMSMAVVGPWVGYGAYVLCRRAFKKASIGPYIGVFAGMMLADLSTYVVTAFQLAWAHPDQSTGIGGAFAKFLGTFAVTQIPLAVAEGLLGVLVFQALVKISPLELIRLKFLHRGEPIATEAFTLYDAEAQLLDVADGAPRLDTDTSPNGQPESQREGAPAPAFHGVNAK